MAFCVVKEPEKMPYYPDNTNIDLSQWQVIGPFNSVLESNDGSSGSLTPDYVSKVGVIVRNISAGSSTVYFLTKVKYIINYGGVGS